MTGGGGGRIMRTPPGGGGGGKGVRLPAKKGGGGIREYICVGGGGGGVGVGAVRVPGVTGGGGGIPHNGGGAEIHKEYKFNYSMIKSIFCTVNSRKNFRVFDSKLFLNRSNALPLSLNYSNEKYNK